MNIAVIGSGKIGGTLGAKWAAAGHQVVFGVRDPNSAKTRTALAAAGAAAQVDTIAHAIAGAEVVLIAIPGAAVAEAVATHGAALADRIVIDATNQFGQLVINGITAITAAAPRATIFRAFNSLGWENFAEPVIGGVQADLLYAGPDGAARATVERLIADIGLRPVHVGDLAQAPLVDNIGALWGALAFGQKLGRRLAFKVLTPKG
jgi:predicted dinucleotide-binding enzyme